MKHFTILFTQFGLVEQTSITAQSEYDAFCIAEQSFGGVIDVQEQ